MHNNAVIDIKSMNVRRYKESYLCGSEVVSNRPVEIYCEVAKCCNISCIMCATHGYGWGKETPLMPFELVEE